MTNNHTLMIAVPDEDENLSADIVNMKERNVILDVNTKNVSNIDSKLDVNTFYVFLQNILDSNDRESKVFNNNIFTLSLGSNLNTPNIYNTSGNVKLSCYLPNNSDTFPNYTNIILNNHNINIDNSAEYLMRILTSFITDPDFLTTYYFSDTLSSLDNDVPLINLRDNIDKDNLCWNWNTGRDYTLDDVKNISNYYVSKFNELIDYIITNDVCVVDKTFGEKLHALFANTSGQIYNYANSTLLLPSLINWLSSKNNGKQHALSMCGYIKQGSKIFPVNEGSDWNSIVKWNDKSDVHTNPYINVPVNINNLITKSKYNYPFESTYHYPQTIETPKVKYNNIANINFKFTNDKYRYEDHVRRMKDLQYATQDIGDKRSTSVGAEGHDTVTFDTNVNVTDIYNSMRVHTFHGDYTVKHQQESSGSWAWCGSYRADKVTLKDTPATTYSLKQIQLLKTSTKKYAEDMVKSFSKIPDITLPTSTINNVNVTNVIIPDYYRQVFIDSTDGLKQNYKICTDGYTDKDVGCKRVEYQYPCEDGFAQQYLKLTPISINEKIKVTLEVGYDYNTRRSSQAFMGSLSEQPGIDATDNSPIYSNKAICLYTTNMDLYLFNDNVFRYWLDMIDNTNNQQIILNEIRTYIKDNVELILLNKINRQMGEYVRSFNGSALFVNIPLGPPLLTIPNSYVMNYKHYYPSFNVNNNIDVNKIEYNMFAESNDIINSISCEQTNNYLDLLFRSIINNSRYMSIDYNTDNVISIILPSKGYQLFEVIDKSTTTIIPEGFVVNISKITDTSSVIFDFNIPKIIMTFSDLSLNNKYKTLLTSYKYLTTIHTACISVTSIDDVIKLQINTKTNDSENVLYVYVSSDSTQEMISNIKGNGADEMDKNIDKNNMTNLMLNIQYNGIDSNNTPICLQLNSM